MNLKQALSVILLSGVLIASTISCTSKVSDADLKVKVETAVGSNPDVLVEVKEGVVTLSGTVTTEDEKRVLETSAKSADNKAVKSVVNNIVIRPIEINTDTTDLAAKVIDATKDFPSVTATVNDGVITVTGTVEQTRIQTLKQSLDALNPKKVDLSGVTVN
jgi:hyperosmotically inducible protein